MQLVPQWAPNIHPLIIHFPIALLIIALLADLGVILFKKWGWLKNAAVSLYVLGALGAIVAYFTGKEAADVVSLPPAAHPIINRHADLALYATLFFGIYALIRLFLFWKKWDTKRLTVGLLLLVAAAGYGLVQQTAEQGGMLVFKYGVGTLPAKTDSLNTAAAAEKAEAPEIAIADNGSWSWRGKADQLEQFTLLQGQRNNLRLQASAIKNALTINVLSTEPFLLTFGPKLANVQLVASVDVDNFSGSISLVHHVKDSATYEFFAVGNGRAQLGRVENGKTRVFDSEKATTQGWITLKAVGSTGHFRGYINDKLIVHGHAKDLPPGTTGLAFSGSGSIHIANFDVISLDEAPMMMNMEKMGMSHQE